MKVFGIGLNKTGTSTLAVCFEHFGFRHTSTNLPLTLAVERGDLEAVFSFAVNYDSFEDWPWPLIYQALDRRFPGSKFILTTRRNVDVWLRSLKKHAALVGPTDFRRIAYGHAVVRGHEREHCAVYERHQREVRDYFVNRPSDFLEVCWENGDGWEKLCPFLGGDVPDLPFPHTNRSSDKTWRRFKRRLGRTFFRGESSEGGPQVSR